MAGRPRYTTGSDNEKVSVKRNPNRDDIPGEYIGKFDGDLTVNPNFCLGSADLREDRRINCFCSRSAPVLYTVINGVIGVWRFESSREHNESTGRGEMIYPPDVTGQFQIERHGYPVKAQI